MQKGPTLGYSEPQGRDALGSAGKPQPLPGRQHFALPSSPADFGAALLFGTGPHRKAPS